MTSIVRRPYLGVYVDGVQVTNPFRADWSLGYTQRVGSASVPCPFVPSWANYNSRVSIVAGASQASARVRWSGFVLDFDSDLYPGAVTLVCRGPLYYAAQDANGDPGGIDLSAAGAGQTDIQIITYLLTQAGLQNIPQTIGGLGRALGTVATDQYRWAPGQHPLDFIDLLDQICLGYRTFETIGGSIIRTQITTNAAVTAALTLAEGVDILSAKRVASIMAACNQVQVSGYTPAGGAGPFNYLLYQPNPLLFNTVIQQLASSLLESSATGGAGIACQEVATWLLGEVNRGIDTITVATPRDDLIGPGMTLALVAPTRLGVNQNYWVQDIAGSVDEQGAFTQNLTLIGTALNTGGVGSSSGGVAGGGSIGGGGQSGGSGGGPGPGGGTAAGSGPTVDFAITVEVETVVVSGAETTLYVVACQSAVTPGSAAISAYAWSTSGGSPSPSSGSDIDFATSYAAIAAQTITLTVTDANGATGTATHTIPSNANAAYVTRSLFLAGTTGIDAFDGATWRTRANASTVVANGPIWAQGANVDLSGDYLASAVTQVGPFNSGTVTAVWFEGDASPLRILAGSSNGAIAYSSDAGATWTICNAAPSAGNAVLRCVWSRFVRGQMFALTAGGLFRTDNYGNGWVTVVAAAGGETFRDVSVSFARIMIAMSGGRLVCDQGGTAQTLPTNSGDITAITADIRADRFYAYDSAGRTFYTTTDAGTTFGARTALPATAAVRGLAHDNTIRGLLYFAAGSAYKSVDGFGSSGGYFRLRQPGVGSAPGGASYVQIGSGGSLGVIPRPSTIVVIKVIPSGLVAITTLTNGSQPPSTLAASAAKAMSLGAGSPYTPAPSGWETAGFDDSAWANAVTALAPGPSGYWTSSAPLSPVQVILFRQHVTLPAGTITGASLYFSPGSAGVGGFVNGHALPGWPGAYNPNGAFSIADLVAGADNVFAFETDSGSPSGGGYAWVGFTITVQYA